MARGAKRKRKAQAAADERRPVPTPHLAPVRRDLLQLYYPRVQTLRDHVVCKLPATSRLRRKKIVELGVRPDCSEAEKKLAHALDGTLVCSSDCLPDHDAGIYQQFLSFSQRGDDSYVSLSDGLSASIEAQCEIVDFVIWLLFQRESGVAARPNNLLCDGFRKTAREGDAHAPTLPGISSLHPNSHAAALKRAPWPHLLALLGQSGQRLMVDLLVYSSVFVALEAGLGNYYQLTGRPLSALEPPESALARGRAPQRVARSLSDITLVRSRIFYAKPALSASGRVQSGYRHIHVLNRCPFIQRRPPDLYASGEAAREVAVDERNEANTIEVMMYIFPRQFGLHNVFTSAVNPVETTHKFSDYTSREREINALPRRGGNLCGTRPPKLPKRLRGAAEHLVRRLQILHARCSHLETLRHYCPVFLDNPPGPRKLGSRQETTSANGLGGPRAAANVTPRVACRPAWCVQRPHREPPPMPPPSEQTSLVELACPASCVSAFCQAVMSKTIPNGFWGEGDTMCHNRATFLHKVDHFIKLRRFESMTLHEISQGQKVVDIAWLRPPGCHGQRLSQGDMNKRQEMFHEFLYYVFDSLLIPLIRSNFYVTESSTHRYEMFYFRHDVWKLATEPSLSALRSSMFEEVKLEEAQRLLNSRRLGYGHLRLLPKGNKFRPIVNLRRRNLSASSSKALNPSINSILGPIHTVLKFEKDTNPLRLGSSLLSVGDVYHRLKRFKESLGPEERRLYLAKIDVHAAFDTIPQAPVTELMAGIFSQRLYTIKKHVEVRPGERSMPEPSRAATRALKRWRSTAAGDGRVEPLLERLKRELGGHRKNTIFVESAAHKTCSVESLVSLLADHVERHLVRFGRKYFRQSRGIPQGSVLSSSLCNYFYADLEMRHLGFLSSPDCLLMRLVDDFLLISLDEAKAAAFVRTMHGGLPDYGVEVSREKTLVNFDLEVEGREVRKVPQGQGFPYCGMLIDSRSLDIAKDRRRGDGVAVANSLTVDFGRSPGHNFQRKILNAFKIQSHLMFYDTSHNSNDAVLQSLEGAFCETGRKMWAYIRCFPRPQRPSGSLIIQTITKVANIAFLILSGKSRRTKYPRYSFDIRKRQVSSIAHSSFLEILSQKQTGYSQVISWLRRQHRRETPGRLSA